jgi:hypothetical protein
MLDAEAHQSREGLGAGMRDRAQSEIFDHAASVPLPGSNAVPEGVPGAFCGKRPAGGGLKMWCLVARALNRLRSRVRVFGRG